MFLASAAVSAFVLLAISPVLIFLYNISPFHPLYRYPGPRAWTGSRLLWALSMRKGNLHNDLKRFHERYGSIVRIAPNELSYIDCQAWRDIYLTSPSTSSTSSGGRLFPRNSLWFNDSKNARPTDPTSIMGSNEESHARYRKAFMPAFTDKALQTQDPILEVNVNGFIEQLRKRADAGETVNIIDWLNYLSFDISGELSFGETFGSVANGKAHPWVEININFGKGAALMASLNLLGLFGGPFVSLLKYLMPTAVRERMMYHRALTAEKVQEKISAGTDSKRADFMDAVLQTNDNASKSGKSNQSLNIREIEINMTILIFAGSETVASSLAGIMTALLQNPTTLAKLQDEIRHTFQTEQDITAASVRHLEYLTAVINEGLRLYPPVPYGVPRVTPKGGAYVCNQFVPEGTFLALNQLPANHSPTNYASPLSFHPERFLDPSPSSSSESTTSIHQPFGLGRHHCLGYKLAWAEMRLILARLIWAFDMIVDVERSGWREGTIRDDEGDEEVVEKVKEGRSKEVGEEGEEDWHGDFAAQKTFIFWEKRPLWLQLRRRS